MLKVSATWVPPVPAGRTEPMVRVRISWTARKEMAGASHSQSFLVRLNKSTSRKRGIRAM